MPPTQVWFPDAARDFSPWVNFQHRLSLWCLYSLCATACTYTCVHVKDSVVHVRVCWIMETLKHPACTLGWVAWLCCSWLSPWKATWMSHGRNSIGTIQLLKKKKKCKLVLYNILKILNNQLANIDAVFCFFWIQLLKKLNKKKRNKKT